MVLSESTPENSVVIDLFSISTIFDLRISFSFSLSLKKLSNLLKSVPDPSIPSTILTG